MLMRKNVNNDVSKDSPIEVHVHVHVHVHWFVDVFVTMCSNVLFNRT